MKAITILQPWASLIPAGAKTIETRSWSTKYRGPIAIHAGKVEDIVAYNNLFPLIEPLEKSGKLPIFPNRRPTGKVIAIADLIDCLKVTDWAIGDGLRVISATLENGQIITGNELEFGDYAPGRYAWRLANVQQINPIPAKGKQRLWEWEQT